MMTETSKIKCPKCGAEISVDDVLHAQIEIRIRGEYEDKQREEKEKIAAKEAELLRKHNELEEAKKNEDIRIADAIKGQLAKKEEDIRKAAKLDAESDQKAILDLLKSQLNDKDAKLQEARSAQAELMKEKAKLQDDKDAFEIEKLKQLENARAEIAEQESKRAVEANENRVAQLQKTIEDMKKQVEEAKRKAEQGSQQSQGEVDELSLETKLKSAFIYDDIQEVSKGVNGSDIKQIVKTPVGHVCGKISWEVKHAQTWSDRWVEKLKEDKLNENADIGVIVSSCFPKNVNDGEFYDGTWICSMKSAIILARALHSQLDAVSRERNLAVGQDEKQQILYKYITGNQFRQRVSAIIDVFKGLEEDLSTEKRWFKKKWAKTEKHIERVINNMAGMQGDLEGMVSLPTIPTLELEFDGINEEELDV